MRELPSCLICQKKLSTKTCVRCKACNNVCGKWRLGAKITEAHKRKISESNAGKGHPNWIADRSKLAKRQQRNDYAYVEWRKSVWLRDNYKCKIANPDCAGRIEVHHILGWTAYPELRYQLNNGITLCHAHHPRKRAEEKRLSPYFKNLVSVSKEINCL